jgi:adenylate cyclase
MGNRGQRYDIYAIVFMFSMAVFLEYQEAFSLIEDETLSYRQIIRTHYGDEQYTTPNEDVVVVYTDEAFYTEYGVFPLRRVDLSTIVTRLARMGAAVIGVDMLLDFNSAYGEDPTLEDAFQEAGNVVLVSQAEFSDNKFIRVNHAIDRFADFTRSGYSNISANSAISESIVRLRYYPEIQRHEGEWPFAVQVVADFLFKEPRQDENILRIGDDIAVQLDQFNDIYIDYPLLPNNGEGGTARLHQVVGLPASDVLFLLDEEELDELSFLVRGKIVLIGEVAEVAHDEFETPVGNVFGVEIIANTISTILRSGPLHAASFVTEMLIALLMMAIFLATRLIANPLPRNLLSVGLLGAYVVSATAMYVYAGLVLSMSYVLISSVVAIVMINARFYIEEMAQKAQIRTAFGQYLSPKVVAELEKNPEKLTLGGEGHDRVFLGYRRVLHVFRADGANPTGQCTERLPHGNV